MAVRTLQLVHRRGGSLNVNVVLYTCPAGHTTIVKDLRVMWGTGTPIRHVVAVRRAGVVCHVLDQVVPQESVAGGAVWVVLEPGDELVWQHPAPAGTNVAPAGAIASGSLLEGTVE